MNDTTRTYRARFNITLDGAVLETRDHQLTITGCSWETITATLDGQPISVLRAAQITEMALQMGTFEKIAETAVTPIGNRVAHALHIELGRLGYGRGYGVASEVLEREVTSLAALSAEDAQEVLSYACGQLSLPTRALVAA
ncbi:hypothetical protein Q0M94_11775 [Deinococcus radiomollis]|uniref:hypothetical protein n=1 Tax=Deinococcus radiomollis TaxID=468916 RepID=UPI003891A7C6